MNRKVVIGLIVAFLLLLVGSFFVKINSYPPSDTRIILEHTYNTYIAPACFEQAQKTNNLAESTLAKARELNYEAESKCTAEYLEPIRKPIIEIVAEKVGFKSGSWSW